MTVPVDCTGGLSTSKELQGGFSTSCPSFLLYFPNHYLSSENALISLFIPACFFGMSVFPESNHSEGLRSTEHIFCLSGWEHWTPSCSSFKSFGTASICFLKLQEYFTVESFQGLYLGTKSDILNQIPSSKVFMTLCFSFMKTNSVHWREPQPLPKHLSKGNKPLHIREQSD